MSQVELGYNPYQPEAEVTVLPTNGYHEEYTNGNGVLHQPDVLVVEDTEKPSIPDHETFLNTKYGDIVPSTTESTGDFVGRDHDFMVRWFNHIAEKYAQAKLEDYAINGDNSKFARDVQFFAEQTADFKQFVENQNERLKPEFEWVKAQYQIADEQAMAEIEQEGLEGQTAMLRRAARRILAVQPQELPPNQDPMVEIVSDFDLTMTKGKDINCEYSETGKEDARVYLEPNIPSSVPAEKYIEKSRDEFAKAFALYWNDFLGHVPHLFEEGGRNGRVPLRDGVQDFFTWAGKHNWDVNIVSANFGRFAHQALAGIPDVEKAGFIAIQHNDIRSTMKDVVLKYMAVRNPHSADVFIGDGGSDKPAINAHDTTAIYFALDGYGFSKELQQMNVCQFTYKDFNDIMHIMDQINDECANLRSRNQQ